MRGRLAWSLPDPPAVAGRSCPWNPGRLALPRLWAGDPLAFPAERYAKHLRISYLPRLLVRPEHQWPPSMLGGPSGEWRGESWCGYGACLLIVVASAPGAAQSAGGGDGHIDLGIGLQAGEDSVGFGIESEQAAVRPPGSKRNFNISASDSITASVTSPTTRSCAYRARRSSSICSLHKKKVASPDWRHASLNQTRFTRVRHLQCGWDDRRSTTTNTRPRRSACSAPPSRPVDRRICGDRHRHTGIQITAQRHTRRRRDSVEGARLPQRNRRRDKPPRRIPVFAWRGRRPPRKTA